MHSLNLKLEGHPGIDTPDEFFVILREFLQPESPLSIESTARSIEDLLPAKAPLSDKVWKFGEVCIEIAEQIPYHHPSQLKLAGLLAYLVNSPKIGEVYTSEDSQPGRYVRFQCLGESLRDHLFVDDENPRDYVNFHAFAANLFECRIWSTDSTWAIWAHRDAFEGGCSSYEQKIPDDIFVLAAAQWILWYGQSLFKHILYPAEVTPEDLRAWTPGPLYDGKAHLSLHRWHFWRDGYNAIASNGKEKECRYSPECRNVATKAAAIMDALEKNMTF